MEQKASEMKDLKHVTFSDITKRKNPEDMKSNSENVVPSNDIDTDVDLSCNIVEDAFKLNEISTVGSHDGRVTTHVYYETDIIERPYQYVTTENDETNLSPIQTFLCEISLTRHGRSASIRVSMEHFRTLSR